MSVGTITVRDKSGAAEASFNVDLAAPLSEVLPQLSRELGAVVGPNEAVLPVLERSNEQLTDLSRSLSSYGVQDGDVILLFRDIVGGGGRKPILLPFPRLRTSRSEGAGARTAAAGGRRITRLRRAGAGRDALIRRIPFSTTRVLVPVPAGIRHGSSARPTEGRSL